MKKKFLKKYVTSNGWIEIYRILFVYFSAISGTYDDIYQS